jgi:hypothetical protein
VLARDLGAVRRKVDHLAGDVGPDHAASRERSPGRHGEVGAQWFVIWPGQAATALATVTTHADSADETARAARFRPPTS